ncbi:MAG: primosomal protein N' [Bacillota bacterium]|nr:primosomal protein N' [Bacillota bacterium]
MALAPEEALYASVVVDVPTSHLSTTFDYRVGPAVRGSVQVGSRVLVPFGRRRVQGLVMELKVSPDFQEEKCKEILAVLEPNPALPSHLVALAGWLARYYLCSPWEAVRCFLPAGWGKAPVVRARAREGAWAEEEAAAALSPAGAPPALTPQQRQALEAIEHGLAEGKFAVLLLHGVTGSGKTEVYLQAAAAALRRGRQCIVLVPEIALTPQMSEAFLARFGPALAVLHSRLSAGERQEGWRKAAAGEVRVVLGTRSAVFAPLPDVGLIIVDEEHEHSYKQEESPRYHARQVALKRAELEGAVVVLGSATPSVESYHRGEAWVYRLVQMESRIGGRPLPAVRVVDLGAELRSGNRSLFSRALREAMAERLVRGEQVILFLNRRGFAAAVVCRNCGYTAQCRYCQVALTYHASWGRLFCHYCGSTAPVPAVCPACGSSSIRHLGAGTERVEEAVRSIFPGARVLRMDVDTTRRKGSHGRILRAFRRGEFDVLVGTQMVAKGLDLPRVTLVGVICADLALRLPDFRAGERTFQLLTQVAGRAGRGLLPGEVIVQTYSPRHFAIEAARCHDYRAFYRQEIAFRRQAGYPPFSFLIALVVNGPQEEMVRRAAEALGVCLRQLKEQEGQAAGSTVLGPVPAPLFRLRGRYRWQILVRGEQPEPVQALTAEGLARWSQEWGREPLRVAVDVDPVSLL